MAVLEMLSHLKNLNSLAEALFKVFEGSVDVLNTRHTLVNKFKKLPKNQIFNEIMTFWRSVIKDFLFCFLSTLKIFSDNLCQNVTMP